MSIHAAQAVDVHHIGIIFLLNIQVTGGNGADNLPGHGPVRKGETGNFPIQGIKAIELFAIAEQITKARFRIGTDVGLGGLGIFHGAIPAGIAQLVRQQFRLAALALGIPVERKNIVRQLLVKLIDEHVQRVPNGYGSGDRGAIVCIIVTGKQRCIARGSPCSRCAQGHHQHKQQRDHSLHHTSYLLPYPDCGASAKTCLRSN